MTAVIIPNREFGFTPVLFLTKKEWLASKGWCCATLLPQKIPTKTVLPPFQRNAAFHFQIAFSSLQSIFLLVKFEA
jgi:hypothetical protein